MGSSILRLLVSNPCLGKPSASSYATNLSVRLTPVADFLSAFVEGHRLCEARADFEGMMDGKRLVRERVCGQSETFQAEIFRTGSRRKRNGLLSR